MSNLPDVLKTMDIQDILSEFDDELTVMNPDDKLYVQIRGKYVEQIQNLLNQAYLQGKEEVVEKISKELGYRFIEVEKACDEDNYTPNYKGIVEIYFEELEGSLSTSKEDGE